MLISPFLVRMWAFTQTLASHSALFSFEDDFWCLFCLQHKKQRVEQSFKFTGLMFSLIATSPRAAPSTAVPPWPVSQPTNSCSLWAASLVQATLPKRNKNSTFPGFQDNNGWLFFPLGHIT